MGCKAWQLEVAPAGCSFSYSAFDLFRAQEHSPWERRPVGGKPVTVQNYGYWQDQFGSDPSIVGKTLALNGAVFTIVGVAPKKFFAVQPIAIPDMWIRSTSDVF